MKHLDFIIWMLGYPALMHYKHTKPIKNPWIIGILLYVASYVAVWIGVGYLVYQ